GDVTRILPVVAVSGTTAFSDVAVTFVTVSAGTLLKLTPVVPVKPVPVTVTVVPTGPDAGVKLVTLVGTIVGRWSLPAPKVESTPFVPRSVALLIRSDWSCAAPEVG